MLDLSKCKFWTNFIDRFYTRFAKICLKKEVSGNNSQSGNAFFWVFLSNLIMNNNNIVFAFCSTYQIGIGLIDFSVSILNNIWRKKIKISFSLLLLWSLSFIYFGQIILGGVFFSPIRSFFSYYNFRGSNKVHKFTLFWNIDV